MEPAGNAFWISALNGKIGELEPGVKAFLPPNPPSNFDVVT
jgi:hypothetical protein